jgi:hypothetical protein
MNRRPPEPPRSIWIRGRRWRVIRDKRLATPRPDAATRRRFRLARGELLAGYCDPVTSTIHYAADLAPRARWRTFVHELLHACMPPDQSVIGPRIEERLVLQTERHLASAIAQLQRHRRGR